MNIYDVIILDESGSMSSIYNETLTSMNEVLGGIRRNQEESPEQRHYVTIVTFEGNGIKGVKTRRDRVPIGAIAPFTVKDYQPGGCTPLYDAMGKTLNKLEGLILPDDKVMVTVITDGMENSSQEYSGAVIKKLVARLRKKGWVLAYIGANQDAVEVARGLNIGNSMNFEASARGTIRMSKNLSRAMNLFQKKAMCGVDLSKCNDLFDGIAAE